MSKEIRNGSIENHLMITSKATFDKFLEKDNTERLFTLYMFYYYTAKWQETNQVKATTSYVSKGLGWGKETVKKYKKQLKKMDLIEDKKQRDEETGQIEGWYVKVNFLWSNDKVKSTLPQTPAGGNSQSLDDNPPNALNTNKENALSTNNKTSSKDEEAKPKEYGDEDINWVLDTFEKIRGFESQGRQKKDRYTAKHLLNNFSKKQIEYMLRWLENAEYAPRVGSVEKLWYKKGDIIAGIKEDSKANSSNVATI